MSDDRRLTEVDPKLKTRYLILNGEREHPIPVDVEQYSTDVIMEKIAGRGPSRS